MDATYNIGTEEILHWGGGSIDTLESVVHIMLVAHVTQATQINSATVGALPADSFQWRILTLNTGDSVMYDSSGGTVVHSQVILPIMPCTVSEFPSRVPDHSHLVVTGARLGDKNDGAQKPLSIVLFP